MLVSGNDILSYGGNAALGNSGQGSALGDGGDSKQLNDSMFNLAYLNMQKNQFEYRRKLAERDQTREAIKNEAIKINEVLPQHRQLLLDKLAEIKKTYLKNGGDVKSDNEVWDKFNSELADFNNAAAQAKSKLVEYNTEQGLARAETNPIRREQILKNMDKQINQKDLMEDYDPYQHTLDFDPSKIFLQLPDVVLKQAREGDYDIVQKGTDLEKSKKMYYDQYNYEQSGDAPHHMDTFLDAFLGRDGVRPDDVVAENLNLVNAKLKKINEERGLTDKDPNYLKPLRGVKAPDGKWHVDNNTAEAVYKIALATKYNNATDKKINLDYAKKRKEDGAAAVNAAKASEIRSRIPVNQARAKYWNSKGTAVENSDKVYNIFDDVVARASRVTVYNADGTAKGDSEFVYTKDIPEGFAQVLSGVDGKGQPIELEPFDDKDHKGGAGFRVVKSPYMINKSDGSRFSEAEIAKAYEKQKVFKTYEEFVNNMKTKGYAHEIELEGKNGRATAQSTIQALRAMNNKSKTQKTDENISEEGDNVNDANDGPVE
jgi:hypothetical protein